MDRKSRRAASAANVSAVNTGAMKRRRYTMTIIAIIAILAIFAAFTFAWFTGIARNSNNQITAGTVALQLLTTSPTNTIGETNPGDITLPAELPTKDAPKAADDLLYNYTANATPLERDVVTLDENENTLTKFLETVERDPVSGEVTATASEIIGALPNFRQQRPIIVYNPSSSAAEYTIDFVTHEIAQDADDPQAALDTAYYFNYTRLYDASNITEPGNGSFTINSYDIDESVLGGKWSDIANPGAYPTLAADTDTVQKNIATSIHPISGKTYNPALGATEDVITIGANSVHIYMVDMGITYTAGNSYQLSDLSIDIVLTTGQTGDTIHRVSTLAELEQALKDITDGDDTTGRSGDTIILTSNITVDKDITPRDGGVIKPGIFNLIPNGYTLTFEGNAAKLEVKFPTEAVAKTTAQTMDIGSPDGGKIIGSDHIQITGNDKTDGTFCSVNWYTDIADKTLVLTDESYISEGDPANAAFKNAGLTGDIIVNGAYNKVLVIQRTAAAYEAARYNEWALLDIDGISLDSLAPAPIQDKADGSTGKAGDINNPYVIDSAEDFKFVAEALNGTLDGVTVEADTYFIIKGSVGNIKHVPAIAPATATGVTFAFEEGSRLFNFDLTEDKQLFNDSVTVAVYTAYDAGGPTDAIATPFTVDDAADYFSNFTYGAGSGNVTAICQVS